MLGFREKVDLERSEIVEAEVESLQVGEVAQAWDLIIQNSENGAVIGFQGERERERNGTSESALQLSLRDVTELGSLVLLPFKTCSELNWVMVYRSGALALVVDNECKNPSSPRLL